MLLVDLKNSFRRGRHIRQMEVNNTSTLGKLKSEKQRSKRGKSREPTKTLTTFWAEFVP